MLDSMVALGPLAFRVTVARPTARDIAALRRGPMRVTVDESDGRFRWHFNWLKFGQFEIFLTPIRTKPESRIKTEGLYRPDMSLLLIFEFHDQRGRVIGERMYGMPREVALHLVERWNGDVGDPRDANTPLAATFDVPGRA